VLPSGLVLSVAHRHSGPARRLVHRLKYQGLVASARLLATGMVPLLPAGTTSVVPIPRAHIRKLQYGVDPAVELARGLSLLAGVPMLRALRAGLWWPRHAGHNRHAGRAQFRQVAVVPDGSVVVDDVVTTGRTMEAAVRSIDTAIWHGIAATSPGRVEIEGPEPDPEARETAWRHDRTG
jgi:predicted amidophosphoribosyltransferase